MNLIKQHLKNTFLSLLIRLVIVQDAELIKVHGHTLKPGDMLNYGQKYGEFIKIKSENMTLQAENSRF
nr:hypothetical protein [Mycoplasmopsis bovis]